MEEGRRFHRITAAALLTMCAIVAGACGHDAHSHVPAAPHRGESVARSAALVGDAAGIQASPGGAMGKPVIQCNAFDYHGRTNAVMDAAFHDVTARGWGCADARRRVLTVFTRWRGQRRPFRSGRLACYQLYAEAQFSTIRCWSVDFNAIRFTVLRAARAHHTIQYAPRASDLARGRGPAVLCGAFRTYFDIAARGVSCVQASDMIRANASRWDHPRIGKWIRVRQGLACILIYVEGDQPTYRCVNRRGRSVRFTRSNGSVAGINAYGRPAVRLAPHGSGSHGVAHLVVNRDSGEVTVGDTHLPERLSAKAWIAAPERSDLAVAPETSVQCPAFGAWLHVGALGIACDQVARLLPSSPARVKHGMWLEGLTCVWTHTLLRCASSTGYQGFIATGVAHRSDARASTGRVNTSDSRD